MALTSNLISRYIRRVLVRLFLILLPYIPLHSPDCQLLSCNGSHARWVRVSGISCPKIP